MVGGPGDSTNELFERAGVWNQPVTLGQERLCKAIIDFWPDHVASMLDIGCGDGKITTRVAQSVGVPAFGLDGSREAVQRCPFPCIHADLEHLPDDLGEYDLVMCTDVLEHLPDALERSAIAAIFGLARRYTMIAVPFREHLPDGCARCTTCGTVYHLNGHLRAYDLSTVTRMAPPGWIFTAAVLAGESWTATPPLLTDWRQAAHGRWNRWVEATCPNCGSDKQEPTATGSEDIPEMLSQHYYRQLLKHGAQSRNHTEVLALFASSENDAQQWRATISKRLIANDGSGTVAVSESANSCRIPSDLSTLSNTVEEWPAVCRPFRSLDGTLSVQIPPYEDINLLIINPFSMLVRSINTLYDTSLNISARIILEDATGIISIHDFNSKQTETLMMAIPRDTCPGPLGLVLRILPDCPGLGLNLYPKAPPVLKITADSKHITYISQKAVGMDFVYQQVLGSTWFGVDQINSNLPHKTLSPENAARLCDILRPNPTVEKFLEERIKQYYYSN